MTMEHRITFPAARCRRLTIDRDASGAERVVIGPQTPRHDYVCIPLGQAPRGHTPSPTEMVRALRQALGYWMRIETNQQMTEQIEGYRQGEVDAGPSPHVAARHLVMVDDQDQVEQDEEEPR